MLVYPLLEVQRTLGELNLSCKAMEWRCTARYIMMREAQRYISAQLSTRAEQSSSQTYFFFPFKCIYLFTYLFHELVSLGLVKSIKSIKSNQIKSDLFHSDSPIKMK